MKVLLTGATGFVGGHLTRRLERAGHTVLAVSRDPRRGYDWSDESLARGVAAADAVIHLAGENLFGKRWSAAQKQLLRSSRFETTKKIAALVAVSKPRCFLSASAIGYYGANDDATLQEGSPRGVGFLAELCAEWEAATEAAPEAGVRTAIVRLGVVLGLGGGALAKMMTPFKLGVGGPIGNGRQWVSWIDIEDLVALFLFLLENPTATGIYNGTAPNPVTMSELARALGKALHRPAFFPVPAPVLRVALGEVADILLTGQRVIPRRALEAGFRFAHPEIEASLRDIVGRKTAREVAAGARPMP